MGGGSDRRLGIDAGSLPLPRYFDARTLTWGRASGPPKRLRAINNKQFVCHNGGIDSIAPQSSTGCQPGKCSESVTDRPGFSGRCNSPDNIADIIRDQQSTASVDSDTDRSTVSLAILVDKTCQDIHRFALRFAIFERHKNDLVTTQWLPVPGSVLTDKGAATVPLRQEFIFVKGEANGGGM
jgi:hypothetical protein